MILRAEDISVKLGSTNALRGVSVGLDAGELVAIVGPNGSGKSTLVRTLAGIIRPDHGVVLLDGLPLRAVPARKRAERLGLLAQSAATPPLMTVREHVGLGRRAVRAWPRRGAAGDERAITHAIAVCEVGRLADRRLDELSGGERQRVRLATLLAQDPAILLLDEPMTGLDIEHQLGLLHTLRRLNVEQGKSIVCILHDLSFALRFFRRIIALHDGRIAGDGGPQEVLCPRMFESVFRVDGRVGCEVGGTAVVVCHRQGCAVAPGPDGSGGSDARSIYPIRVTSGSPVKEQHEQQH